jgi:Mg-chelatase subunit ChlD
MSVSLSASLHKPLSLLAASEKPRLAVRILPTGAAPVVARRSFHLGLLLDVSGSMDGDRLAALKTTIRLLIDALMDGDCLTVIKYESSAQVVAEAQIISSVTRTTLRDAIDALRADGGSFRRPAVPCAAHHSVVHRCLHNSPKWHQRWM